MSITDFTLKGKFDEAAGKVKQSLGEATNDQSLANAGTAEQVKGHAEQAWGSIKGAYQDKKAEEKPRAEDNAHDVRERIASTAQNVKERVQTELENLRK